MLDHIQRQYNGGIEGEKDIGPMIYFVQSNVVDTPSNCGRIGAHVSLETLRRSVRGIAINVCLKYCLIRKTLLRQANDVIDMSLV